MPVCSPLFRLVCVLLLILLSAAFFAFGSPEWLLGESLADILFYQVLLDEARYAEAGLVLDRLLASGGGASYFFCLEAEYSFTMLAHTFPGDWMARAGRATDRAMQAEGDEKNWRARQNRALWLKFSFRYDEALTLLSPALCDPTAPVSLLYLALEIAVALESEEFCGFILDSLRARGELDDDE